MLRFLIYVAVIALAVGWLKRVLRSSTPAGHASDRRTASRPPSGATHTLVCASCGTAYAPQTRGFTCPKCGQ